ncbi:MAG: hypothetical protein ABIF71_09610 [Planctomycetota bacterium]
MAGRRRYWFWTVYGLFCAAMVAWGYLYFSRIPVYRGMDGELHWTYTGQFHRAIKDAHRIVISYFTHDGSDFLFKPVAEVTDPQEIAAVYKGIEFEQDQLAGHCMCVSFPIEWYKGGHSIARITLHHGRLVRWRDFPDWPWPHYHGDGRLTEESWDFMVDWLAGHGVAYPAEERDKFKAKRAAYFRCIDKRRAILPDAITRTMREGMIQVVDESYVAAFEQAVPDPVERALLLLRLDGVNANPWINDNDSMLSYDRQLLNRLDLLVICEAITRGTDDPGVVRGAARWAFGYNDRAAVLSDMPCFNQIAMAGLASPWLSNGKAAIAFLDGRGNDTAAKLPRSFLRGEIPSVPASEDETILYGEHDERIFPGTGI